MQLYFLSHAALFWYNNDKYCKRTAKLKQTWCTQKTEIKKICLQKTISSIRVSHRFKRYLKGEFPSDILSLRNSLNFCRAPNCCQRATLHWFSCREASLAAWFASSHGCQRENEWRPFVGETRQNWKCYIPSKRNTRVQ